MQQQRYNVPTERSHGNGRVSGARKIDIATGTLGYSVNDDKRLPSTVRSPLITSRGESSEREREKERMSDPWRGRKRTVKLSKKDKWRVRGINAIYELMH